MSSLTVATSCALKNCPHKGVRLFQLKVTRSTTKIKTNKMLEHMFFSRIWKQLALAYYHIVSHNSGGGFLKTIYKKLLPKTYSWYKDLA